MLYTSDWSELAKLSVPNLVNYCRKQGYTWNVQCVSSPFSGYQKILYIQQLFNNNEADLVVSIDCDVLITNYNKRVEDYLSGEHSFFICNDFNGINAGVFAIKKTDWSKDFLSYLLLCQGEPDMHCEQDAIIKYTKEFPNDTNIQILPHPSINSYLYENYPEIPFQTHEQGQWVSGDFLLHLPGLSNQKRIEIFNNTPVIL
jgi:hypothetical protein